MEDWCERCRSGINGPEHGQSGYEIKQGDRIVTVCEPCMEELRELQFDAAVANRKSVVLSETSTTVSAIPPRLVPSKLRLKAFARHIGETESAVRSRIRRGEWLRGQVWFKDKGKVYISLEGYEEWLRNNTKV
jgi:hypothetical protein